jgi:uncharacterized membrane protein
MAKRRIEIAEHVAQTVETVASIHARAEDAVTPHQRAIERTTASLARPAVVYVSGFVCAAWVVVNALLAAANVAAPDPPPFALLQCAASVLALLTTLTILTAQNRQAKQLEQRAHLDLQVNLLAEQKTAKIIALLEELRQDLPMVEDRVDPVAEAMKETVDPAQVLEAFEATLEGNERATPSR